MAPLVVLALGSVVGAALYPLVQPPFASALGGAAAALGLAAIAGRRGARRSGRLALLVAGLLLGLSGPASLPDPPRLAGDWRLRARVVTAAVGSSADVTLSAVARPAGPWAPATGRVRVRFPTVPPPPGTAVLLEGAAYPIDPGALPGEPDPAWDAARSAVASTLHARFAVALGPPPAPLRLDGATHAGLLRAMLNGDRSGVPEAETTLLRHTGTVHLVSISGLHIGLCASVAWGIAWLLTRPVALLWRFGGLRWLCAAAAVGAACAYADLAGWPLSARRAVWMVAAGSVLAARGTRGSPGEILALAWLGTTAVEPSAVASVGALLSFGSLLGVLLVGPRITRWLPPDAPRAARWLVGSLATTVGATAGTLPVIAWYFQDLAPTAPLANLVAVPLMGGIGTPALLASQVLPGELGALALWIADRSAGLTLAALSAFDVAPVHPAVGLAGALVLGAAVLLRRHVAIAGLLATLALGLVERPVGCLAVTFLDVGQGDSALIEWPDGRAWLVDGGPPGTDVLHALRRRGIRRLDTVVMSHPHPDHIGGLAPVLAEMPVGTVWIPRLPVAGEADYADLLAKTRAFRRIGRVRASGVPWGAPGVLPLLPTAGFAPRSVNDESLAVRVRWGERSFLFAGDVEAGAEAALVDAPVSALGGCDALRADVLKVPHHGSRTSSTEAFVACVRPEIAVISAGRGNRYGHPNVEALARLRGVNVYRTDRDGSVEIRTDGKGLEVTTDPPDAWVLRGVEAPAVPATGAPAS